MIAAPAPSPAPTSAPKGMVDTIPFGAMTQQDGWGAPHPAAIDPSKLYGLQWQVVSPGASFDVWIDDIQFTGC